MVASALVAAFDAWLWAPTSALPLAAFRILFGAVLFVEAARLVPHAGELFAADGILGPVPSRRPRVDLLSPLVASRARIQLFFLAHVVACAALTIGFLTPLAALLVYVNFASRQARAPTLFHGGDGIAVYLSLLLVFTPAGSALSCDARLGWVLFPSATPPIALRMMQAFIGFVYWRTFQWKTTRPMWIDGTALFRSYYKGYLARGLVPATLLRFRAVSALGTWGALAVEAALPLGLLFADTRRLAVATHVVLQVSILLLFRIKAFQWIMLASAALFLEEGDVRWALGFLR